MAKMCPITNEVVLYLDCIECEDKICKLNHINNNDTKSEKKDKKTNIKYGG